MADNYENPIIGFITVGQSPDGNYGSSALSDNDMHCNLSKDKHTKLEAEVETVRVIRDRLLEEHRCLVERLATIVSHIPSEGDVNNPQNYLSRYRVNQTQETKPAGGVS